MRETLRALATITIATMPEDIPIEGNACACGEEDCYDSHIRPVMDDLEVNGNRWAWCIVHVKAVLDGFEGHAWLGGCSYANEEDFKRGGYYEDMVDEALTNLQEQIEAREASIAKIRSWATRGKE
mgnify:CR=1 FL=1